MTEEEVAETNYDDIIRIMVATDNHLGYAEKDPVRGDDSFIAFEEILEMAVAEDVDMILLGGDLFHDAVPSQNTLHKCIEMLRRYTFGEKPVSLEILSDPSLNFHNSVNQSVNYEDPNLNIAIPVFSIHGNHDDPSPFGRLSSLDLLSTMGLVNYFGRWTDLTQVEISPILISKGDTKMALYGLSHIHDVRLARLFKDYKVFINGQDESEQWFQLMVVHQNRADRGPKNYIPEEALPSFLNLVIWGHEHDCRIDPELNAARNFYVSQPGSSVATSLSEGESKQKHVGLLEIKKNEFLLNPMPLKTVRPFVFESVTLPDYVEQLNLNEGDASTKVFDFAVQRVNEMIEKANTLLTGHPKQPKEPLIRLRLLYKEESHMFNTIRFSQMFGNRVANPADVVKFDKIKRCVKSEKISVDKEAMQEAMEVDSGDRVEQLIENYFKRSEGKNLLKLLHPKALSEITCRLVEHTDNRAEESIFNLYSDKAVEHLMDSLPDEDNIDEELATFRERNKYEDLIKQLGNYSLRSTAGAVDPPDVKEEDVDVSTSAAPARGGARGRGRGARGARGKAVVPATTTSKSSGGQMLLNAKARPKTYVISDDSD